MRRPARVDGLSQAERDQKRERSAAMLALCTGFQSNREDLELSAEHTRALSQVDPTSICKKFSSI